ncbi:C-terminal binding protein, partial [Microbacteriaceae bacterium K1510]|nr:C-terminal binding protein [Microbacteriaceae bacterium K1510]
TALIDALSTGKIAGAALDVFEQEPLPVTHPLTAFPNVLLSPHTAWAGPWTLVNDAHRLLRGVADQLRR